MKSEKTKMTGKSKIYMILFYVLLTLVVLFVIGAYPRTSKNIQRKMNTENSYAIQNVAAGKDIRVHNANIENNEKIILYEHQNWECITWQFIQLEGDVYLLKNLYTHKTFQPLSKPEQGVSLAQQTLEANSFQYWEFLKQSDETYLIRLKDTELYVTVSSNENNSPIIILMPLQNSAEQQWRLIEQRPIM